MGEQQELVFSAEEVKEIREKHRLTLQQFAEALQVNELTVRRWENSERECRGRYAYRVKEFNTPGNKKNLFVDGKMTVSVDFSELESFVKQTHIMDEEEDKEDGKLNNYYIIANINYFN